MFPENEKEIFCRWSCAELLFRRIAGEAYAEFFEDLVVDFSQHHGRVSLATAQEGEGLEGVAAVFVVLAQH